MIYANDFNRQWSETRDDVLSAVETVGDSGWYILGRQTAEFEAALAVVCGRKHAIGVASGLDAIEISLRALGCERGDKVLTTPVSAFATTLAIIKAGATPVFVDCDEYGLIDLDQCEVALRSDPDIHFFVPVHLYGHSLDLARLRSLSTRYGVRVVEDCAQSLLASHAGGQLAGTVGEMAATSFYPTKNLGALGDGGAILTDSDELAASARMLRDYGQSGKYRHSVIGFNSRLDELQAAILRCAHLPRLESWTSRRREIARTYIDSIHHPEIRNPGAPPESQSCWHLFPVFVSPDRKPAFLAYLRDRHIVAAEHYPYAIVDQPAMQFSPMQMIGDCRNARLLCRSEVSIPVHPQLTDEEIAAVIRSCNEWSN